MIRDKIDGEYFHLISADERIILSDSEKYMRRIIEDMKVALNLNRNKTNV